MEQVNHLQGQQKMRQAAPRKYDGENGNPYYNPENGGHYGTSARHRAASRGITPTPTPTACRIHYANLLSQAPLHPYVLPAHPRLLATADILVQIAAQNHAPDPQLFTGSWQNVRSHTRLMLVFTEADDYRSTKVSRVTTATS
jgi:hypothetical protein